VVVGLFAPKVNCVGVAVAVVAVPPKLKGVVVVVVGLPKLN